MIKKTTKVVFEGGEVEKNEELIGGMPLSKGEIVHMHRNDEIIDYKVTDKVINYYDKGEDQIVDITYTLKKK